MWLVTAGIPIRANEIDISFERPTREWSSKLSRPTINLFSGGKHAGGQAPLQDVLVVASAAQTIDVEKATKIAEKMKKGSFDLEDLGEQLKQMQKLGGMGGVLGMLPGVAKIKGQINEAGLDKSLVHQRAIIGSMTPQERRNPHILNARRRQRIAKGSGVTVTELNTMLNKFAGMQQMMKKMGKFQKMLSRMGGGPASLLRRR